MQQNQLTDCRREVFLTIRQSFASQTLLTNKTYINIRLLQNVRRATQFVCMKIIRGKFMRLFSKHACTKKMRFSNQMTSNADRSCTNRAKYEQNSRYIYDFLENYKRYSISVFCIIRAPQSLRYIQNMKFDTLL